MARVGCQKHQRSFAVGTWLLPSACPSLELKIILLWVKVSQILQVQEALGAVHSLGSTCFREAEGEGIQDARRGQEVGDPVRPTHIPPL